jgi:hypothetical protein
VKVRNYVLFLLTFYFSVSCLDLPVFGRQMVQSENNGQAPQWVYADATYTPTIKTVQFFREGWELSYPILALRSEEKLILSFDDLEAGVKTYGYTLIHCDSDWNPSGLFQSDYLDGFYQAQIRTYNSSFSTFVPYTNYRLTIPNEDMKPKLSGNYLLKVFLGFNEEDVVITRRFYISENSVTVSGRVKRPVLTKFMDCCQELVFTISHRGLPVYSPMTDIRIILSQNNRPDKVLKNLKPQFIRQDELVYENQQELIFSGGNEFRRFDIKSLRYQSEFIKSVSFDHPFHYVDLFPSKPRAGSRYFFDNDLNGNFIVAVQEGTRNQTDAEYVIVNFRLEAPVPFQGEEVHVYGRFTDWALYPWTKMEYNYQEKAYELSMFVKQGYYNYLFALVDPQRQEIDTGSLEGDFHETENDYYIYIYLREPGSRYERLVGFEKMNVLKN